jgi:hypothetical protein
MSNQVDPKSVSTNTTSRKEKIKGTIMNIKFETPTKNIGRKRRKWSDLRSAALLHNTLH